MNGSGIPVPDVAKISRRRSPPGSYEVRYAGTGALHSFEAVDNVAQALAQLPVGSKSWFGRREPSKLPDLEYRTCATSSKADAKAAARAHDRPPRNLYERRGLMDTVIPGREGEPGILESSGFDASHRPGMTSDQPSKFVEAGLPQRAMHRRPVWAYTRIAEKISRKSEE